MGARSCYTAVKQFLRAALPETERFALEAIERVSKIESQFGGPSKPVFMVFSGKGGEGKSFQTRLLADYLRRHWANGRTLAESPLP